MFNCASAWPANETPNQTSTSQFVTFPSPWIRLWAYLDSRPIETTWRPPVYLSRRHLHSRTSDPSYDKRRHCLGVRETETEANQNRVNLVLRQEGGICRPVSGLAGLAPIRSDTSVPSSSERRHCLRMNSGCKGRSSEYLDRPKAGSNARLPLNPFHCHWDENWHLRMSKESWVNKANRTKLVQIVCTNSLTLSS